MRLNAYLVAALVLLGTGFSLLVGSVVLGEGTVSLIVIIPVFYGTGLLAALGVLSIIAGFFLLTIGLTQARFGAANAADIASHRTETGRYHRPKATVPQEKRTKSGGFILIGPIPIIFGSDTSITKRLVIIGLVVTAVAVVLWLFFMI